MSIQSLDDIIGVRNRATVLRRLRWIEDRLGGTGSCVGQNSLRGSALQQASQDIATYQQVQAGFKTPEPSTKSYVRSAEGRALFPQGSVPVDKRGIGREQQHRYSRRQADRADPPC